MAKSGGVYTSAEVKAGLVLTFCLALFVSMLFIYGKASRLWKGREELTVFFTSVTSLRPDAPVRFNGVEVGRVRNIRIVNLTPKNVERLPRLTPATSTTSRSPSASAPNCAGSRSRPPTPPRRSARRPSRPSTRPRAKKIAERTMIELVLEVLSPREAEGSGKRYRVDDKVRISTTLLGDTSVEIASGSGELIEVAENSEDRQALLGISGDFFTNLGKSVEQVKEILASVSDVVGPDERDSVRKALRRFDTITSKIETIVDVAHKRLPVTWDKVDTLADSAKKDLDAIGETVTGLQPQISKTLTSGDEAIKDLQKRLGDLADEARQAVVDVKTQVKPILDDVHYITQNSKEDFPELVKNSKDLAARLKLSADKLDAVLQTGEQLLKESYGDFRRLILAFRRGSENFEEATNLIKRKPWLILNKPERESEFTNASQAVQKLEVAMKQFKDLNLELQAIRRNLPNPPNEVQMQRMNHVIQQIDILLDTLGDAGDVMRKQVQPEFQRKQGAFIQAPETEEVIGK
ncbi:MAG: MlaD family protein [Planctomycetota bacterium]|nr:MlaD family protein [Planctomycetota bacterium]